MSKSGVPEAAMEFLEPIASGNANDSETMGILGSIYKELFKKEQATKYALLARDTYEKSFQQTRNYYNGINAASMSVMAGKSGRGRDLAQQVLVLLKDPGHDAWEAATEGEALLLLKERSRAEEAYRRAHQLMGSDWGKINSVYNQLWLLNHYLPVPSSILKMFSPPVVAAFVGHMIDKEDRQTHRFPRSIEPQIKEAILHTIRIEDVKIGYCSLACGGDILFAEAIAESGGELNLFLPFKADDFVEASVQFAGEEWVSRFHQLISRHPVTQLTTESYENHPDLFALQSSILFGLAILRAASNHEEPKLISVLSGGDIKRKLGGTRDALNTWPFPKRTINIDPDRFSGRISSSEPEPTASVSPSMTRPVLYLACCDLPDEDLTSIILAELESAFVQAEAVDVRPDKLLVAYKNVFNAIQFGATLAKIMAKRPLMQKRLRMSLHVGPMTLQSNDVRQTLAGKVAEALEKVHQITVPGSVFATANVAAILALDIGKYRFHFVDTIGIDGAGDADIFRVELLGPPGNREG